MKIEQHLTESAKCLKVCHSHKDFDLTSSLIFWSACKYCNSYKIKFITILKLSTFNIGGINEETIKDFKYLIIFIDKPKLNE